MGFGNRERVQTPFDFDSKNYSFVRDILPPPTICHYCFSSVKIMSHKEYYGHDRGSYPWVYACTQCKASTGIHKNTDLPLGIIANKQLRAHRGEIKQRFLSICEDFEISIDEMYKILAKYMKISRRNCHFAWFLNKDLTLAGEMLGKIQRKLSNGEPL